MPPNFTKLTIKHIAILTLVNILIGLIQNYIFQHFSAPSSYGSNNIERLSMILVIVNFFKFSIVLGFGIRELCRSNHHQNSAGSVFLFSFWMALIPFLLSLLTTYVYTLTDDNLRDVFYNHSYRLSLLYGLLSSFLNCLIVISFAGLWRVFRKAEANPWLSLIPIANLFGLVKIAKLETYWAVVLLIPIINLITLAYLVTAIAKAFNKSNSYALGLYFLPFIFYPILGFGDSKYLYRENEDDLWIGDHLVE